MLGDDGDVYYAAYSGMGESIAHVLPAPAAEIVREMIRDGDVLVMRRMRRIEIRAEWRREGEANVEVCTGTISGCRLLTSEKARAERRKSRRNQSRPANENERLARIMSKAVIRAALLLSLSSDELAALLGIRPTTAGKLYGQTWWLTQGTTSWTRGLLFVRAWTALNAMVGDNDEHARGWLRSKTKGIRSKSPLEHARTLSGLKEVVRHLEANTSTL